MSSRVPIGSTNRSDLFVSARKNDKENTEDLNSNNNNNYNNYANNSNEKNDQNPLQIDHIMGYAGDSRQTVLAVVGNENIYIKSLGSVVLVEDLIDPQNQKLLRGHDMEVIIIIFIYIYVCMYLLIC